MALIHRVRLYHSTEGAQEYHDWLEVWLTNMEPWEDPEVENDLPKLTQIEEPDSGEYYRGELAFAWSEDRAHILDNLDQYADAHTDWHRIGYHECTHDEDGGPCDWDEQRESGDVPHYIPQMSP